MYIEIVDDNVELTKHLKKSFIRQGNGVRVFNTREDFIHNSQFDADLFLMDINLGDGNGLDLIQHMRMQKHVTSPVIVISGQTRTGTKKDSFVIGADDFLEKPFTIDDLNQRIGDIFAHIQSRTGIECGCLHKPLFSCLSEKEKSKIFSIK